PNGKKPLFCTTQPLSLLHERTHVRQHLSGERLWQERHAQRQGQERPASPWQPIERIKLVQALMASGDIKRLAVVCAAGLGKTTNLHWLAKELASPTTRQVPFGFKLDDQDLPDNLLDFWNQTLPGLVRRGKGNSTLGNELLLPALMR